MLSIATRIAIPVGVIIVLVVALIILTGGSELSTFAGPNPCCFE
jgi:hypothetical protein